MQLAKKGQRRNRARQRADADGDQAQQQRAQGAEDCHNQQNHPENRGDTEGGDILFRLLAGVVAVKYRPARQQLRLREMGFQLAFKSVQRCHQTVRLLHIEGFARQLAVQQIPVISGIVFGHQPAVHQPQLLAVLRQRQLRTAHQH
ncbi:hypothetical protein D3C78_286620 [compost metagenome]